MWQLHYILHTWLRAISVGTWFWMWQRKISIFVCYFTMSIFLQFCKAFLYVHIYLLQNHELVHDTAWCPLLNFLIITSIFLSWQYRVCKFYCVVLMIYRTKTILRQNFWVIIWFVIRLMDLKRQSSIIWSSRCLFNLITYSVNNILITFKVLTGRFITLSVPILLLHGQQDYLSVFYKL